MMQDHVESGAAMATKLTPPIAVLGAHVAGIQVAEWIQWLTLVYLLLLVGQKVFQIGRSIWIHYSEKQACKACKR
jgi:hypothetical protein